MARSGKERTCMARTRVVATRVRVIISVLLVAIVYHINHYRGMLRPPITSWRIASLAHRAICGNAATTTPFCSSWKTLNLLEKTIVQLLNVSYSLSLLAFCILLLYNVAFPLTWKHSHNILIRNQQKRWRKFDPSPKRRERLHCTVGEFGE